MRAKEAAMGLYDDLTWDKLNPDEKTLAERVRDGKDCDFRKGKTFDAKDPKSWDGQLEIRGRVIAALATGELKDQGGKETIRPTRNGVVLYGARIPGGFDLSGARIPCPFVISQCLINNIIDIAHAYLGLINFSGSRIEGLKETDEKGNVIITAIHGNGLHVNGTLSLQNVFAHGKIKLLGANVAGDLNCQNGIFQNLGDAAFDIDGLKAVGDVLFDNVEALGEVRLISAHIGGNLDCISGIFENPKGAAFSADRVKTSGDASLDNVKVTGEASLIGADIGGSLDCGGGTFENLKGVAFNVDGFKTGGDVHLDNVKIMGEMRFIGANIGGDLDCTGGTFVNPEGDTFLARNAVIKDSFFWSQLKSPPQGIVGFNHMRVGVLADDPRSWPEKGKLWLSGFEYGAIASDSPTDSKSRLEWLERMPSDRYTPQPYRQLSKILRQMGHETDARAISIARMDAYRNRKKGELGWGLRAWYLFIKWTAEYGYEPWRALYFAGAIVVLFAMVAHDAYHRGVMHPVKERVYLDACYANPLPDKCSSWISAERRWAAPIRLPKDYPEFNSLVYAIDVFFPFVDLHQEDYWEPNATQWGGFFRLWMWFAIGAGWILSTIGIAAFTGIVKGKED